MRLRPWRPARLQIDPAKRGSVVGQGGKTIKEVLASSGATNINIDDEGGVSGGGLHMGVHRCATKAHVTCDMCG